MLPEQKTVLIADDQPALRQLLRATLSRIGLHVIEATNGSEALTLARQERPDLVLMDVGMPQMDGLEVCRALKADPDTAQIPVFILTARAQQIEREKGLASGATVYLTKPFKPAELRGMLREHLSI
jgi:two-component system phosphate regulon response regulator PhoB